MSDGVLGKRASRAPHSLQTLCAMMLPLSMRSSFPVIGVDLRHRSEQYGPGQWIERSVCEGPKIAANRNRGSQDCSGLYARVSNL